MDDFPRETPRFWIAFTILCIAFALSVIMATVASTRAHAQPRCDALATVIDDLGEKHGEVIVWEGNIPTPNGAPVQAMLFQSPKGSWTMVAVQGIQACFMAAGTDATPIETGKGI